MPDSQSRLLMQEKIRRISHKMIDAIERIVDQLAAKAPPARSRAAERRQVANLVGASQFCARRGCRRAHCCLGEPAECLRIVLPLLDGDRLAGLMRCRRKRVRTELRTARATLPAARKAPAQPCLARGPRADFRRRDPTRRKP